MRELQNCTSNVEEYKDKYRVNVYVTHRFRYQSRYHHSYWTLNLITVRRRSDPPWKQLNTIHSFSTVRMLCAFILFYHNNAFESTAKILVRTWNDIQSSHTIANLELSGHLILSQIRTSCTRLELQTQRWLSKLQNLTGFDHNCGCPKPFFTQRRQFSSNSELLWSILFNLRGIHAPRKAVSAEIRLTITRRHSDVCRTNHQHRS